MKYKNTCNVYHKHLDLDKRIKIEKGIENNWTFSKIAKDINKSPRTISYEILKNRNVEYCTSWYGKKKICDKTLKPPYVCNSCPARSGCRKTRYYYYAEDAQGKYEKLRSDSRKGIDMTSTEFKNLNDTVSNEIRNGHSFSMIVLNGLLFVPFGFLLPIVFVPEKVSWKKGLLTGFLFSMCIEICQLFTGRMFEWDDIFANSFGALFGFLCFSSIYDTLHKDSGKNGFRKMAVTMVAYGAGLFLLFFLADAERVQNREGQEYPGISEDAEAYNDIAEMSFFQKMEFFSKKKFRIMRPLILLLCGWQNELTVG